MNLDILEGIVKAENVFGKENVEIKITSHIDEIGLHLFVCHKDKDYVNTFFISRRDLELNIGMRISRRFSDGIADLCRIIKDKKEIAIPGENHP